ncbi:hypothetical protein Pcinc_016042 [Petrolisthes cinctipes]|uniref:Nck-associated protein 5 n=1 Tax=Petrolisthes cinctipes TaxID=88211 RepID=A0AAE1FUF8_PETCI|nr:hypothetical protein Pcinc_016042 [Petrolisthes cinctipes]
MDTGQKGTEDVQVESLRRENEEVKNRLSTLQHEFTTLEEQVRVLVAERRAAEEQQRVEKEAVELAYTTKLQQYQATLAALEHSNPSSTPTTQPKVEGEVEWNEGGDVGDSNTCVVVQMLAERCRTLEQTNKRLQEEARTQQRQYEVCLDRVATQVVQALLSQKSHQEQCIKLAHQVKDLRRQNAALSTLMGPAGMPQTLPCHHRHRCPAPVNPAPFLSLPTSLTKNRHQGEGWPTGGWVASWRVDEGSRSQLGNHDTSRGLLHSSDTSIPTSLSLNTTTSSVQLGEDCYTPHDHHLSTTTTVTSANTSTTTCWYDIVTSLSLASSPQGAGKQLLPQDFRLNDRGNTWDHIDSLTPRLCDNSSNSCSSGSSSSESPDQSDYPKQDIFSRESEVAHHPDFVSERRGESRTCLTPPPSSDSPASKFSPLSLESASISLGNSPDQKSCQSFQTNIDNVAFSESKTKLVEEGKKLFNSCTSERNANILVNTVTTNDISNILEVKERLMKSLTETNPGNLQIDLSVLSCEDKSKGVFNKNLSKVGIRMVAGEGEEGGEVGTKDEGYSTMSSDVQAVKDATTMRPVATVQEEPAPATPTPASSPIPAHSTTTTTPTTSTTTSSTITTAEQHPKNKEHENLSRKESGGSSNSSRSQDGTVRERKVSSAGNTEYCDGLRVIYDEEDNNSDVFFIPIQEPENESLYRHSYHVSASVEKTRPVRCSSDSQLYIQKKSGNSKPQRSLDRHVSEKDLNERSPSTEEVLEEANNTRSLKRSNVQASLKKKYKYTKEEIGTSGSSEDLWPSEENQRKYLSPTYSQAELEDWSLDLSSEYLSGVCGEGEGSESVATSGAHHGSLPSIQEATPDLEEDNNEFLWNGATYFKADLDLNWSSKKELTKSWQLDHCKENNVVSPRSGCSDQPAVWSSSEQLSCCSEGVSKCSSDFENFCEQICNLPELKRVSFCSSEAGGQELSKGASQDTSSAGEHEEELDDVCVDTVFTRDFYRLVKFESNKSLAASSKSLATSEGLLTIEKLQEIESGGTHKETLASVLGFIAEQQKYCQEREAQDEKESCKPANMIKIANALEDSGSLASVIFRGTFPKRSPRELPSNNGISADDFSMRTLPSCNSSEVLKMKIGPPVPAKPRSCFHQGVPKDNACEHYNPASCPSTAAPNMFPAAPPLNSFPILPPTSQPTPFVPSRSSSLAQSQVNLACEVEVPHTHLPEMPPRSTSQFPGTNSVEENTAFCTASDIYDQPPPVPERHVGIVPSMSMAVIPPIPRRSSSKAICNVLPVPEHKVDLNESPPVPKRITSRALPQPPPELPSQILKQPHSNGSSKPIGGSLEGRRRSFIKETLGLSTRRPQSDYCELPCLSENPAGMLKQLQVMAQVEEEEERRRKSRVSGVPLPSVNTVTGTDATSPGDTAGLGTGWVRVQPHVDLQDPQARANLLDGMMESSEGCSSETEEEEGVTNQYAHLRSIHRSRRKRKASHRSGGERIILGSGVPRPTIIGRKDLFVRYGELEKEALQEFEFLGNLSTSYSDLGSQDLCSASSTATKSQPVSYPGPLYTSGGPVMKKPSKTGVIPKTGKELCKKNIKQANNRTVKEQKSVTSKSGQTECVEGGVDTSSICSVKNTIRQLNKFNHISGIRDPATTTTTTSPAKSASSPSSTRVNLKSCSPVSIKKQRPWAPFKAIVDEGNTSGTSKFCSRQGSSPTSRTPSPQLSLKERVSPKSSSGSQNSEEKSCNTNSKTSSPTRIPRIQTSLMSSKKSRADSPKAQKDVNVNDPCSDSTKLKTPSDKALPPKGFSSRVVKSSPRSRPSLQPRQHQSPQQQTSKTGIKSPRLARVRKAADPLDSFTNKSLCDSGSSEGSERCGGRLSLSDSCAENFSPIDSGDEVFYKEC